MKRALFITKFAPPHPGIASVRTAQIVRYLPKFGWDVTLFTVQFPGRAPDEIRVVETPSPDALAAIKRALGLGNRVTHEVLRTEPAMHDARKNLRQRALESVHYACAYATNRFGWYAGGISAARTLASSRHFDAVLSTSPPESAHLIASALAARIPWVADFRDLWVGNSAAGASLYQQADRVLERAVLRRAHSLVTVSPALSHELKQRYGKPVYCIPNAFDAQEWEGVPFGGERRCTVLYAGNLYDGRRDPRPMFQAVQQLLRSGAIDSSQLEIAIYSKPQPWLKNLVAEYGLQDVVELHPFAERKTIMELERRADLLWTILFDGDSDAGVLTGKLFEYLGARRPIIATGGPQTCELDGVLARTGAGTRARTVPEIAEVLLRAIRSHEQHIPEIPAEASAAYEVQELARCFASVLDGAAGFNAETNDPVPTLVG